MRKIPGCTRFFLDKEFKTLLNGQLEKSLSKRLGADRHESRDRSKEHDLRLGEDRVW